jgi:hypothetical protein
MATLTDHTPNRSHPSARTASRLIRGLFSAGCLISSIALSVAAQQIVDQMLTLVNGELITRTDLLWSIAMDPQAPSPSGPVGSDVLRRKLDVMIDQRLIAQEAGRIPASEITQDDIDKARTEIIKAFRSESDFRQRVGSVGLTPQKIDELIRQRILIERFVDFRFRSFVLVTDQDIRRYYDEVFAAEMRAKGQVPPPLEHKLESGTTVYDTIREIIRQQKINDELDRYITSLRQRADVVTLAEP